MVKRKKSEDLKHSNATHAAGAERGELKRRTAMPYGSSCHGGGRKGGEGEGGRAF